MTGQKPEGVSTDIELLPLPAEDYVDDEGLWEKRHGPYSHEQMEDYARANVAHAAAAKDAEIERLRAEEAESFQKYVDANEARIEAEVRAERLAEVLSAIGGTEDAEGWQFAYDPREVLAEVVRWLEGRPAPWWVAAAKKEGE